MTATIIKVTMSLCSLGSLSDDQAQALTAQIHQTYPKAERVTVTFTECETQGTKIVLKKGKKITYTK